MTIAKPILNFISGHKPVSFVAGVLILALAAGAYFFADYRAGAGQAPPEAQLVQVSIGKPADGAQLSAFSPTSIQATAIGPQPFLSMELWANGELVSVAAASGGGQTPLSTSFAWLPKTEGSFSMVARAIDQDGQAATSEAILVQVGPMEAEVEIFPETADSPAFLSPPGGGYAPPSAPNAPTSDAEDWNGSPGDWINNLTNDEAPTAPELAAETEPGVCQADLFIHDLSANEAGFAVFIQLNGSSWQQIATLAPQSQEEWIKHPIQYLASGQTSFYVTAFNSHGEAQSNLVSVMKSAADCTIELLDPSLQPEILLVNLKGLALLNNSTPDKLYCYRSINGGPYSKWPGGDFFYPDTGGNFSLDEVLAAVLFEISMQSLGQNQGLPDAAELLGLESSQPQSLTIDLECWGWYGSDLQYLGSLHYGDEEAEPGFGKAVLIGDAMQAELEFQQMDWDDWDGDPGFFDMFTPTSSAMMPPVLAYISYDPDECKDHLPLDARNDFGKLLFCFPYPGFNTGPGGANPQPYLVWAVADNVCNSGNSFWDEECLSYQTWLNFAETDGGQLGFRILDFSEQGTHFWNLSAPHLTQWVVPPLECTGTREFTVSMVYQHPKGDGPYQIYQLPWTRQSNTVKVNCPQPTDKVKIEIRLDTLELWDLDDGDSGPDDIEMFGYFNVGGKMAKISHWKWMPDACPDEAFHATQNTQGTLGLGCQMSFTNGIYNWADIELCQPAIKPDWPCPGGSPYQTNNNVFETTVGDGGELYFYFELWDFDDSSGDDMQCQTGQYSGSRSTFEWSLVENEVVTLTMNDQGNGGCQIKLTLNAIGSLP